MYVQAAMALGGLAAVYLASNYARAKKAPRALSEAELQAESDRQFATRRADGVMDSDALRSATVVGKGQMPHEAYWDEYFGAEDGEQQRQVKLSALGNGRLRNPDERFDDMRDISHRTPRAPGLYYTPPVKVTARNRAAVLTGVPELI